MIAPLPEILSPLNWLHHTDTIPAFLELGVSHGFLGKKGEPPAMHRAKQVHGDQVVEASEKKTGSSLKAPMVEADGIYTQSVNTTVGVVTADCLPVLLVDKHKKIVMAVHAGWRGLVRGVLKQAMRTLSGQGFLPGDILVAIGPAISISNYQVGPEVTSLVLSNEAGILAHQAQYCFRSGDADYSFLSLNRCAAFILTNAGVRAENISIIDTCTFAEKNHWHSYRRDKPNVGRNHAWIKL